MTASGNLAEPIKGQVDEDVRLVSADPLLMRLHLHCGGYEGGPLAVPQLAQLCRLSKKLGMNLSRPVAATDDDNDISLWVETRIAGRDNAADGIILSIVDWQETPSSTRDVHEKQRQRDFDRLNGRGEMRTDAAIRIMSVTLPGSFVPTEKFIGQSLFSVFDIIPPSKNAVLMEAISERQPVRGHRIRAIVGDKKLYSMSGQPLIDNTGLFSGYRLTMELDPQETADSGEGQAAKGNLISDSLFGSQLGPALRQPLGKIIANAETIGGQLEGPLRGDYAGYAKDIASAGRHLMALVNDLSDLEAIERANFKVAADEIDLVDLAHRVSGLLAVKAADHQMRIDVPSKDETMPASGEFRRVLQILVNLVGNAIRYSPDGSVIKVRVSKQEGMAIISVRDQGEGIAPEDHDRIFEKFERLDRTGDGGSGLGLFISRRLANAMDGTLTVESEPGKGALFSLALPSRTVDPKAQ